MTDGIHSGPRKTGHRSPSRLTVIVVEGRSEKIYFERFRTREQPIAIRIHESKDHTAEGMVGKCIDLIKRSGLDTETDDVIAVFDADRNAPEEIESAVKTASNYGIKVYVSNPSFEFWLLLHFEDNRANCIQEEIEELLGRHLMTRYKKSEGINKHIDSEDIRTAVVRSRNILPSGDPVKCKAVSPSTCLHLLVEKIMKNNR